MQGLSVCKDCQQILKDVREIKQVKDGNYLIRGQSLAHIPEILIQGGHTFLDEGHIMVRYKSSLVTSGGVESGGQAESEWLVGSLCRIFK